MYFPGESLKPHSRQESSSKAAFRDHCETLYTRSAGAWRDAGLSGLLNEISNSSAEVPKRLEVSSSCVLALLRWVSSFHCSLFPHLTLSSEDMTTEFSQVLDWSELCSAELRLAPTYREVCCFPFRRLHQDLQPQECYYSHPKAPSAAQCDSPAVEASVCVCPGRGLSQLPAGLARGPHLALYQTLFWLYPGPVPPRPLPRHFHGMVT
uniref:Achalasia, adrenocortical insufficiency, alacrimia n=1 Tax=Hucho hucho TaxID=62062 RepID=A0A4W5M3P5_9TELE